MLYKGPSVVLVWAVAASAALSPLTPVVECVIDLGGGQYAAHFGYLNTHPTPVTLPIGEDNRFLSGPIGQGQPTSFAPGRAKDVFTVNFNGSDLPWLLYGPWDVSGPNSVERTATATKSMARPANSADLSLSSSSSPSADPTKRLIRFTATNQDPCTNATGVTVKITIPASLTVYSSQADAGSVVSSNPAQWTWTAGTLNRGRSANVDFLVGLPLNGSHNINGSVKHSGPDPNASNDNASVTLNGQSSSGGSGGLESNGRLAQLVARRLLLRALESPAKAKERAAAQPVSELQAFLPQSGPDASVAAEVSPRDLTSVTNAASVLAYDYVDPLGARVGSILAIVSGGPYEHSKATCDRLAGGTLEELRQVEIQDKPFLLAKLRHPDGTADYSISFAVSPETFPLVVDARWDLFRPSRFGRQRVYNFQIWGANAYVTLDLARQLLDRLPQSISTDVSLDLPAVFVRTGEYRNGKLLLDLGRMSDAPQEVTIRGALTRVEGGVPEDFSTTIRFAEAVQVPVGAIFDANLRVGTDPLYLADGAWSTWTDAANGRISVFEPQPQGAAWGESDWAVERDVSAQGTVRSYVTILRHLRPAARPVDLRAFDYLEFTASGAGTLEVVPQKRSISDFSRQFRTNVVLTAEPQTVRIRFSDLGDGFSPDDVTTLVFNILGNHAAEEAFDLRLSGIRFGKDAR